MASLQDLLTHEGFEGEKFLRRQRKVKFKERASVAAALDHESSSTYTLPIYICHDRKSFDFSSRPKTEKGFSRSGSSVTSSKLQSGKSSVRRSDEPALDEIAIRAVVSILSGYVGQYLRDKSFRETIREKCNSCLVRRKKDSDNGIFANMELGIESIERLVENPGTKNELKMKSLRNSIGFLTIVASLNSKSSKNGSTSGTPNSHLSACAQLYLSIVYKIEKNDRISARHLLQVFCDSPNLARTHLLPELWEHLFLPHLLHLKIWYSKQVEILSNSDYTDKENRMKSLSKVYDDQVDKGTIEFALYYKEWLKTGAQAPTLPTVPLPSHSSYAAPSRRRSSHSFGSNSSINKFLLCAVFGPNIEPRSSTRSVDFDNVNGNGIDAWSLEEEAKLCVDEYNTSSKRQSTVESRIPIHRRSMSQGSTLYKAEAQKQDYLRFLPCRSEPTEYSANQSSSTNNASFKRAVSTRIIPSNDLSRAVNTLCTSESLNECEMAIRVMTKAWLDSHGDPIVEKTLSKAPVIDGMLEVLFASENDEVLELVISILAEFVIRKDNNGQIILNSDPQLETFIRLMRNSSLFLKAASLLHLVKPKAKQMISDEWVPLVLRVLEFGDQLQMLFSVQCSPQVAAYYFLEQLLNGLDEDKNLENARQVVSLGGLSLLVRRIMIGDIAEKGKAVSLLYCCIRADGRCRHYIANNLSMDSILALLVLEKQTDQPHQTAPASALLAELICLHRVTQRSKFLNDLISGWGCLNTMQILVLYLKRAQPEEQPIVAALLLQLDLMGDPLKYSVFREEAVEAIIAALDCQICSETVQQQSAKALSMLGGRFSYSGEPEAEKWLLKEAGCREIGGSSFHQRDISADGFKNLNEDDEATEIWQRKAAVVLFSSGNEKLLTALSDSIANGIPSLARASLVTVSWMSTFLHSVADEYLQSVACSILVPRLTECLKYDKAVEERVLASLSLLCLSKCSAWQPEKGVLSHLQNLSRVTWTASKLTSIITSSPRPH